MIGIEEPIQLATAPIDIEDEPSAQGFGDALERHERAGMEVAPLEARDD
jgi:hypothetical protein